MSFSYSVIIANKANNKPTANMQFKLLRDATATYEFWSQRINKEKYVISLWDDDEGRILSKQ